MTTAQHVYERLIMTDKAFQNALLNEQWSDMKMVLRANGYKHGAAQVLAMFEYKDKMLDRANGSR